jgi:hypothetical protein
MGSFTQRVYSSALKIEAAGFSEILVAHLRAGSTSCQKLSLVRGYSIVSQFFNHSGYVDFGKFFL